ncbi:ATP:cob(I)alamin adenosyltransferase [Sinorhizobium medicae]
MVKLDRIYTRGGDKGETSLGDGTRISKGEIRVEAYGAVDETNATIGLARLHVTPDLDDMLKRIQNDLFDVGADLCTPHQAAYRHEPLRITQSRTRKGFNDIHILQGVW